MPNITRNHYFFLGMFILLLGLQFRFVETYVLKPPVAKFLAQKFKKSAPDQPPTVQDIFVNSDLPIAPHPIQPPKYLNFACISIGAVLILHGVAMRPD